MAITYHAGRRIQGLSTDIVDTLTFEDDSFSSGWDRTGTQIATNSGSGEIDWNARVNGTNHSLVHDLQDELGSGVYLGTQYVARFKLTVDVIQSGGFTGGNNIIIGFSDSADSVGYTTAQDFHGLKLQQDGGGSGSTKFKHIAVYNTNLEASGTNFATSLTTQTYYVELVRDGNDFTTKLLDSNYSVLTEEESTTVTNIQLRYFKISEDNGFSSSANFSGTVDDIKIYNGVTSLSSKPTDVQVQSRFEETDTRKMYYHKHDKISTDGNYTVLNFTEDGTFTPTSAFNVEYLVIGGGGGGFTNSTAVGSGGGAGALRTNLSGATNGGGASLDSTYGVTAQNYTVTVGAGGAVNTQGGDSSIVPTSGTTITSNGGAEGVTLQTNGATNGNASGSGAGTGYPVPKTGGAGGTYGNDGGNTHNAFWYSAGGGGGSGGIGGNSSGGVTSGDGDASAVGGNGGIGLSSSITGTATYYAGGGGGGTYQTGTGGSGGSGVGGQGGGTTNGTANGTTGTANTGSGGGGGTYGGNGATGGSGVVIIRFLTSGNTYTTSLTNTWQELGT